MAMAGARACARMCALVRALSGVAWASEADLPLECDTNMLQMALRTDSNRTLEALGRTPGKYSCGFDCDDCCGCGQTSGWRGAGCCGGCYDGKAQGKSNGLDTCDPATGKNPQSSEWGCVCYSERDPVWSASEPYKADTYEACRPDQFCNPQTTTTTLCGNAKEGGSATAFGDPHLKNIRGEVFQVRKRGVHTMLNVPQGAEATDALLRVDSLVEPAASECSLFIKRLVVAGQWLGAVPTLTFAARDVAPGHADGVMVGNSSWLTIQEFTSLVPPTMVRFTLPRAEVAAPAAANRHATTMMAALKVGSDIGIKISWASERTPVQVVHSLWVSVTGLSSVAEPIGGLLGMDDHGASMEPDPCKTAAAELIAVHRDPALVAASATL